jgi:hypothetical protein
MKTLSILLAMLFVGAVSSSAQKRGIFPVRMDKVFYYDSIPNPIVDSGGIWTHGFSQKSWLKPDTGTKQVWITDTVNLLTGKKLSHLDFAFPYPERQADNYHISIKHKFDFDSLSGGSIFISTDGGEKYYPIWSDTGYFSPNWWHQGLYEKSNLLFNGEAGFSGKSNNWVQTELNFTYFILVKKPELRPIAIRFVYQASDSSKAHEGWMIEEVKLGREYRNGAVSDVIAENPLRLYPNPTSTELHINTPENGYLRFMNQQGEVIWQDACLAGEQQLNLPTLSNGLYYVEFVSDRHQFTNKIVIQNP